MNVNILGLLHILKLILDVNHVAFSILILLLRLLKDQLLVRTTFFHPMLAFRSKLTNFSLLIAAFLLNLWLLFFKYLRAIYRAGNNRLTCFLIDTWSLFFFTFHLKKILVCCKAYRISLILNAFMCRWNFQYALWLLIRVSECYACSFRRSFKPILLRIILYLYRQVWISIRLS